MAEYIKREAAVKAVEKYGLTNGVVWGRHTGLAICIASEIADIPAADVAPVVHGRWIHDGCRIEGGIDWCHCSECGKSDNFCARTNYCPNCGAKMDGGDSDEAD